MSKRDHRNNPNGVQPVAYDTEGRPLYAAPYRIDEQPSSPSEEYSKSSSSEAANNKNQRSSHVSKAPEHLQGHNFKPRTRAQYSNEPGVIHTTREIEPAHMSVSEDMQKRHEASKKRYPHLNLSAGESVILDIKRHPIGLLVPFLSVGVVWLALSILLIFYPSSGTATVAGSLPSYEVILFPVLLLMLLTGIGGYIAVWVYLQNQFFLTNESVIQEIQHSLFSRHEQTVSLGSIEDASFKQHGLLQTFLDYGMIRLSTEGEETTYRFAYVSNPRKQVAILNNAVEAFKNGRPVDLHEN